MATTAAPSTPDVLDNAISASTAGHPVSADTPSSDVLDNSINDSLAGRPVSTAAPVAPPAPGTTGVSGFLNQVGEGGREAMHDIYGVAKGMVPGGPAETGVIKTIWNNLPPVQLVDSVKQTLPLIHTYETARSNGASMSDALTQVNETAKQHASNITQVKPVVDAFRANPTRETARALLDATAAATSLLVGGEAIAPEAEAAAAPAAEAVGSPSWLARNNPFREGGPLRRAISPTAATQPEAQTAFRQGATASATDAGVTIPAPAEGAGIRTLMAKPIEQAATVERGLYDTLNKAAETDVKDLYERQEAIQDALDDPTQVAQRQALQTEAATIQTKINWAESNVKTKLGVDAPKLLQQAKAATQQRYAMETGDAKLFNNESVVKGNVAHNIPESIQVDPAIRNAELLDKPSKFAPRGSPTRLQQMFGVDGAKAFKDALYAAQKTGQTVVTRNTILKWGIPGISSVLGIGYELAK